MRATGTRMRPCRRRLRLGLWSGRRPKRSFPLAGMKRLRGYAWGPEIGDKAGHRAHAFHDIVADAFIPPEGFGRTGAYIKVHLRHLGPDRAAKFIGYGQIHALLHTIFVVTGARFHFRSGSGLAIARDIAERDLSVALVDALFQYRNGQRAVAGLERPHLEEVLAEFDAVALAPGMIGISGTRYRIFLAADLKRSLDPPGAVITVCGHPRRCRVDAIGIVVRVHHETGIEIEAVALAVVESQFLLLERLKTAEFHAAEFDIVEVRIDQMVDILLEAIDPAIARDHAMPRGCHCLVIHFQIRPCPVIEAHQHSGRFRLVGNDPEIEPAADL